VVGRFAPKANPEYRFHKDESEINLLVATDVLSEGLNLQDCDKIINYDLHWNPVRLIQRFGRIDRIGSEHDVIWGFNFLPETELDKNLGLKDKLANRIREIHETIGLDAAVLDSSEQLNPEAMYAIYEKRSGGQLSLFEEPDEIIDLNEAEEFMRQLKKENPKEFERIANLRDGIRVGKASETKGTFVFCQAGKYQKLFLMSRDRKIVNQEIPEILNILRCGPEQPSEPLPPDHNQMVMKARRLFDDEVQHRMAMREQTTSLSHGQRYVIRGIICSEALI
jgi:superfamily II DNA/RNA helicase